MRVDEIMTTDVVTANTGLLLEQAWTYNALDPLAAANLAAQYTRATTDDGPISPQDVQFNKGQIDMNPTTLAQQTLRTDKNYYADAQINYTPQHVAEQEYQEMLRNNVVDKIVEETYRPQVRMHVERDYTGARETTTSHTSSITSTTSGNTVEYTIKYGASGQYRGILGDTYSWSASGSRRGSESISPPRGTVTSIGGASITGSGITDSGLQVDTSYAGYTTRYFNPADNVERYTVHWNTTYKPHAHLKIHVEIPYSYEYTETYNNTTYTYTGSSTESFTLTPTLKDPYAKQEHESLTITFQGVEPGHYQDYDYNINPQFQEIPPANDSNLGDYAQRFREQHGEYDPSYIARHPDTRPSGYSVTRATSCDKPRWLYLAITEDLERMKGEITGYRASTNPNDHPNKLPPEVIQMLIQDVEQRLRANQTRHVDPTENEQEGSVYGSANAARLTAKQEYMRRVLQQVNQEASDETRATSMETLDDALSTINQTYNVPVTLQEVREKNNLASKVLDSQLNVPLGTNMTLTIHDKPREWTETTRLAVYQEPNYLFSNEEDQIYYDLTPYMDASARINYPLGVRNVCLFSLPYSADAEDLSKDIASFGVAVTRDNLFKNLEVLTLELGNESLNNAGHEAKRELTDLTNGLAANITHRLPGRVYEGLDPALQEKYTREDIERAVQQAVDNRSDIQLLNDTMDGSLSKDITENLLSGQELSPEYQRYLEKRTQAQVNNSIDQTTNQVVIDMKPLIKAGINQAGQLLAEQLANELEPHIKKQLEKAQGTLPAGLPILPPPYTWVCTVNVWYIEVEGDYLRFTVMDQNNKAKPHPALGHTTQTYTRIDDFVKNPFPDDPELSRFGPIIGQNKPIGFKYHTAAFIIVPPGPPGVGDKNGEWDEKSPRMQQKYG